MTDFEKAKLRLMGAQIALMRIFVSEYLSEHTSAGDHVYAAIGNIMNTANEVVTEAVEEQV